MRTEKLFFLLPWVSAALITLVSMYLGFSFTLDNFDRVLDSIITFSSIILGFLAALLGILITVRNSPIMKEIQRRKETKTIKHYFFESIFFGFLTVILSTVLHITTGSILFYTWNFAVVFFVISSYRIINTLMRILFKADQTDTNPEAADGDRNNSIKQKNIPIKSNSSNTESKGQTLVGIEKGKNGKHS